jgi:hypothetical protein
MATRSQIHLLVYTVGFFVSISAQYFSTKAEMSLWIAAQENNVTLTDLLQGAKGAAEGLQQGGQQGGVSLESVSFSIQSTLHAEMAFYQIVCMVLFVVAATIFVHGTHALLLMGKLVACFQQACCERKKRKKGGGLRAPKKSDRVRPRSSIWRASRDAFDEPALRYCTRSQKWVQGSIVYSDGLDVGNPLHADANAKAEVEDAKKEARLQKARDEVLVQGEGGVEMVALKSTRKGRKGRGNRGSILSAGSRGGSIEQPWERLSAGNVLESENPLHRSQNEAKGDDEDDEDEDDGETQQTSKVYKGRASVVGQKNGSKDGSKGGRKTRGQRRRASLIGARERSSNLNESLGADTEEEMRRNEEMQRDEEAKQQEEAKQREEAVRKQHERQLQITEEKARKAEKQLKEQAQRAQREQVGSTPCTARPVRTYCTDIRTYCTAHSPLHYLAPFEC